MAVSTVFYTWINSQNMPTQQGMPGMKTMMYIFPFMMLFFMNSLPAGLSYYYLLANLISILPVSYTHLRAHETVLDLVCRLLLEKKK